MSNLCIHEVARSQIADSAGYHSLCEAACLYLTEHGCIALVGLQKVWLACVSLSWIKHIIFARLHTPCFTQAVCRAELQLPVTAGADDARGRGLQKGAVCVVYCAAERQSMTRIVQSRATARPDVATPETHAVFLSFLFSFYFLRFLKQKNKKPIAFCTSRQNMQTTVKLW